jgi:hypothetical protein
MFYFLLSKKESKLMGIHPLLSLRANEASAAISTGKPVNWLTKLIG